MTPTVSIEASSGLNKAAFWICFSWSRLARSRTFCSFSCWGWLNGSDALISSTFKSACPAGRTYSAVLVMTVQFAKHSLAKLLTYIVLWCATCCCLSSCPVSVVFYIITRSCSSSFPLLTFFFFSLNCARLAGSCASASQFPTCHSEQSAGSVSSQTIVWCWQGRWNCYRMHR